MKVSVFGNREVKEDSLVVELLPELKKRLVKVRFKLEDPVEGLSPPDEGEWVIVDVAKGVKGVKMIRDLDKLETSRRVSLHDYDLGMELKLLKKLGKVKKVRIIAVEMGMDKKKALKQIVKIVASLL